MKHTLTLGIALLFSSFAIRHSSLAADTPPKRPNILHIHADDHRADGLGAFGHPVVKTPNLDTLVARGFTFTHCYTMGSNGRRGVFAEPHDDAHGQVVAAHSETRRRRG